MANPGPVWLLLFGLLLPATASEAPVGAATQCDTPPPPQLRIGCGEAPSAELCAERGCCWDAAPPPPPSPSPSPGPPPGCLGGQLRTPAAGVHTLSWAQHVAFANPAGYEVQLEIYASCTAARKAARDRAAATCST